MAEPVRKTDLSKKPETRVAGAASNREDVFNSHLPEHPDDGKPYNEDLDEQKITAMQAIKEGFKEAVNKVGRKSVQLLGMGNKKEHKDGDKKEESSKKDI
jgi:hypothetical protein